MTWVAVLLIYSYVASVLPVWTLLQPRDFINSLQLLSALALVLLGLLVAGFVGGAPPMEGMGRPALEISAPAFRLSPEGAPWIFPFLFITIACGAISGFHCLVSSGTSSKQICSETDAQFVGFGSMLTEGFLAVLVILACIAGIGLGIAAADGSMLPMMGESAYMQQYATWSVADGLSAKVGAFVEGSANFLKAVGMPAGFAIALMGVFVASFAVTTLDTACRLQRYVIQELARALGGSKTHFSGVAVLNPFRLLRNKHGATLFAVIVAFMIAAFPVGEELWNWTTAGRGGLILWPLFGATNQLLGGLAFLVIAFWMWRRNLPVWFVVIPMVLMLFLPGFAMILNLFVGEESYVATRSWTLIVLGFSSLVLQVWIVLEACLAWPRARGILEEQLEPLSVDTFNTDEAAED